MQLRTKKNLGNMVQAKYWPIKCRKKFDGSRDYKSAEKQNSRFSSKNESNSSSDWKVDSL
jgi:hypothetical protein